MSDARFWCASVTKNRTSNFSGFNLKRLRVNVCTYLFNIEMSVFLPLNIFIFSYYFQKKTLNFPDGFSNGNELFFCEV